ncbi:MAG: proton-conducting transporter membrane subunit [Lachnospiraceae bacterium]|nr:proton-conducting transporter membrane subunit [Lachnospiraceae bacterium]
MSGSLLPVILVGYPFAGALLVYLLGRKNTVLRDYLADFVTVSEFVLMAVLLVTFAGRTDAWKQIFAGSRVEGFCGMGISFELDGFRLVYGTIACLMWMMTTILSREYFKHHENVSRFYLFLLLTFGATMGVFLSADLYTTFIFFEIMSFTSYVWVAQEENAASLRAASTYLAVAIIGGLVMLMGLFLVYHVLGTLTIRELLGAAQAYEDKTLLYVAGVCMLTGFGAKAGAFPLHIWLPKAHPVAPAPASALLSGILTKTGIFGILIISSELFLHDARWGKLILFLGVCTMAGGALLAVFSIDLKRTLACSSMSQIGFIMVGIGMQGLLGEENALAVHGAMLHMVNHSMIKLVLFMAAGVIFMNTHALDLNEIRGFGRKKPLLKVIFLVGALAIGGIPLFGGYISKTLIHESIVEYSSVWSFKVIEWIFLASGGLTVAYMTKLFVAVFVEENENREVQRKFDQMKRYMNAESTFALAGSAVLLFLWGLFPHDLMDRVAVLGQNLMHLEEAGEAVSYFSMKNLSGGLISIAIGALVYVFFIRRILMEEGKKGTKRYINAWPAWFDLEDAIYRPVLLTILPLVCRTVCRVFDSLVDTAVVVLRKTIYRDSPIPHELPEGTVFTQAAGNVMNFFRNLANGTWRKKVPVETDYRHKMAMLHDELKETNTVIGRSLSFGLMLVCIGFCVTLIYIIWW